MGNRFSVRMGAGSYQGDRVWITRTPALTPIDAQKLVELPGFEKFHITTTTRGHDSSKYIMLRQQHNTDLPETRQNYFDAVARLNELFPNSVRMPSTLTKKLLANGSLMDEIRPSLFFFTGDEDTSEVTDEEKQELVNSVSLAGGSDVKAESTRRRGMGKLRSLIRPQHCPITGSHLVRVSHVKAWSACGSIEEKLDPANAFLFSPNVDDLFTHPRGWISFDDFGNLLVSSRLPKDELTKLGIPENSNIGPFTDDQKKYMQWHREYTFKE